MSNKIKGNEYTLSKIFSSDFEYHIPGYQRPLLGQLLKQESFLMIYMISFKKSLLMIIFLEV